MSQQILLPPCQVRETTTFSTGSPGFSILQKVADCPRRNSPDSGVSESLHFTPLRRRARPLSIARALAAPVRSVPRH
jgi:hypothetical protein